jgi:maltooligosyltrehalose trehalohydrolase
VGRRLPIGAEVQAGGGVHFRVWAPACDDVRVVLVDVGPSSGQPTRLTRGRDGYYDGHVPDAQAGSLYYFELGDGSRLTDPASRFQPRGPHGPSEVIDPGTYSWHDQAWPGIPARRIVYELHVGTFTQAGTWAAATAELPALAALGINVLEILPIAEFPGAFGWGYDGVLLYAPTRLYGRPDDVRAFVDEAHRLGLGVVLDVVYNHCGPDGCPLGRFAPAYFAPEPTEWGQALNFDGPDSAPVREFVCANAAYWVSEFHVDGLRVDATQAIKDTSTPHILADVARHTRQAAGHRRVWIVGENEPQHVMLLQPPGQGGCGFDALWNDDWHHAASVALTGFREAYYLDYRGAPQEFISAAKYGFLYHGQWYSWQRAPRGTAADGIRPDRFVAFLENHDQVANSLDGRRLHLRSSPGRYRALTALLLLGPWTPMLFQGQEFAATSPFFYFAGHQGDLATAVRDGRRQFLSQFASMVGRTHTVPDPDAVTTFERSKLNPAERDGNRAAIELHRSLIALRRSDPAFHGGDHVRVDGAVLSESAFVLRFSETLPDDGTPNRRSADRLVVINLRDRIDLTVLPEPLLSPHPFSRWRVVWSSEAREFGGAETGSLGGAVPWTIPAESATVLAPSGA